MGSETKLRNSPVVPSSAQFSRSSKLAIAFAGMGFLFTVIWSWWLLTHPLDFLAGCGGRSGCATVLSSRWSKAFGIPVTILATFVYMSLLGALLVRRKGLVFLLSGVLLASVLWFLGIQAIVLRAFCPWCIGAHLIGLLAGLTGMSASFPTGQPARRWFIPLGMALAGVTILALVQTFGPVPASHRVSTLDALANPGMSVHARGGGRVVDFSSGRKRFAIEALPHLGDPQAPHVLVEYFDYQCASCRVMHGHFSALLARHPGKVCLIVLPVPLEANCNPHLPDPQNSTPGSCLLSRLSLAVWRHAPDRFPAVHQAFFADPSPSDPAAQRLAREIIPADSWPDALSDLWIDQVLAANIQDWQALSNKGAKLPKVLLNESKVLHGLPSGREEFLRVIAAELGL